MELKAKKLFQDDPDYANCPCCSLLLQVLRACAGILLDRSFDHEQEQEVIIHKNTSNGFTNTCTVMTEKKSPSS